MARSLIMISISISICTRRAKHTGTMRDTARPQGRHHFAARVCRVSCRAWHPMFSRVPSALAVLLLSQGKEHRPGPSFSFQAHDEGTPIYQLCFLGSNVLIRCVTDALPCAPRREPCPILDSLSFILHPSSTTHHLHLHQRRREGDKGVGLGQTARQGRKQLAVFIQRKYAHSAPPPPCCKLCSLCVCVP